MRGLVKEELWQVRLLFANALIILNSILLCEGHISDGNRWQNVSDQQCIKTDGADFYCQMFY